MKIDQRSGSAFLLFSFLSLLLSSCHIDTPEEAQNSIGRLKAMGGIDIRDSLGDTALILSAAQGHYYTVKILLDNGADVNARNKSGTTALMALIPNLDNPATLDEKSPDFSKLPDLTKLKVKTLNLLVSHGADVSATNRDGRSALMIAALEGDDVEVDYLIRHGADVNQQDDAGKTALQLLDSIYDKNLDDDLTLQYKKDRNIDVYDPGLLQNRGIAVKQAFLDQYGKVIKVLTDAGGK